MPCYHPLQLFRTLRGQMCFKRPWPVSNDLPGKNVFVVPCGQCIGCRLERARVWALRCEHERRLHEVSCFLTLTYDEMHLPQNASLVKEDLQKFWKRLRFEISPDKLRYFACGEYGEVTCRPHYHAIVFGWTPPDLERSARSSSGCMLWSSAMLDRIWSFGRVVVGEATFDSAGYVARYVTKKITGDLGKEAYFGRVPPYVVMSRRPGIGEGFFEAYRGHFEATDCTVVDGRPSILPRYYLEKIRLTSPEIFETIKAQRLARALEKPADDSLRLSAREDYRKIKAEKLVRNYE
ncbi:VP4 [Gokushovirus WZ-2015a]|nr:VP4 [Gokushovirus WZ-2015a]ALS03720.1 VP4 [Gokushovirus WZ-2015a]